MGAICQLDFTEGFWQELSRFPGAASNIHTLDTHKHKTTTMCCLLVLRVFSKELLVVLKKEIM